MWFEQNDTANTPDDVLNASKRIGPAINPWTDVGMSVVCDSACNCSAHGEIWLSFSDWKSGERCKKGANFKGLPAPRSYYTKRFDLGGTADNRVFAGIGGSKASKCKVKAKWLMLQHCIHHNPYNLEAVETREIGGSDSVCLFALDLICHLEMAYIVTTNRCYQKFRHGPGAGLWNVIPVCQVQGSGLPIIRIDMRDAVDAIFLSKNLYSYEDHDRQRCVLEESAHILQYGQKKIRCTPR